MDRAQLLDRTEREWRRFLVALEGIPDSLLTEPRTLDEWSLADVLGHVATWEEETITNVSRMLAGGRPRRYGGIDAFNAQEVTRKRAMSAGQVHDHLRETHERLARFLASIPEESYAREGRVRRQIRVDTTTHYKEHTEQVLAWRRERGF